MQKSRTAKVISLILAIIMLAGIFPASVLADSGNTVNSYDEYLTDLLVWKTMPTSMSASIPMRILRHL